MSSPFRMIRKEVWTRCRVSDVCSRRIKMIPQVSDDDERVIVLPGKSGSHVLAQIQLHIFFCLNFLLLIKQNIA